MMVLALSQPRIACAGPLDRRFVASKPRSLVPVPRRSVKPKAFPDVSFIADLADAAPGSVDAPLPVVAGLAIAISAAALLIFSFGLKPGADAAAGIQQRDDKSGRWRKKE